MKKGKIVRSTLVSLAVALFAMASCEKEVFPTVSVGPRMFYDAGLNATFSLTDQAQLNRLAENLAAEPTAITLLDNAAVVDLTDRQGSYKAISMRYQVGEFITTLVVPIQEVGINGKNNPGFSSQYVRQVDGCEMKCITTSDCKTCAYEIRERCKSQMCSCAAGDGIASGSVSFAAE